MAGVFQEVASNGLILDAIFAGCDEETLKTGRLVNKTWANAASRKVKMVLDSKVHGRFVVKEFLETYGQSTAPVVRRLVIVGNHLPKELSPDLGSRLIYLKLKGTVFPTIAALKGILLNTFPNLMELSLDAVSIRCHNKIPDFKNETETDCQQTSPNLKLRKLSISASSSSKTGRKKLDAFEVWGYSGIFTKYPRIKELSIVCLDGDIRGQVFTALQKGNIQLDKLTFEQKCTGFITVEDKKGFDAMESYINGCGRYLKHLSGRNIGGGKTIERTFKNFRNNQLFTLELLDADLMSFGQGEFDRLHLLSASHVRQQTFQFIVKMPVLKYIKYHCGFSNDDSRIRDTNLATSDTVKMLSLTNCGSKSLCQTIISLFPFVEYIVLREDLIDPMGWIHTDFKVDFNGLIAVVQENCPCLISLKVVARGSQMEEYFRDNDTRMLCRRTI